jgi:hypothetical protein
VGIFGQTTWSEVQCGTLQRTFYNDPSSLMINVVTDLLLDCIC